MGSQRVVHDGAAKHPQALSPTRLEAPNDHFLSVSLGTYCHAWYIVDTNTHLPGESEELRMAHRTLYRYSLSQEMSASTE